MPRSHRHYHHPREVWGDISITVGDLDLSGEDQTKPPGGDSAQKRDNNDDSHVRTVYKTLSKTFDGPVAGYRTIHSDAKSTHSKFIAEAKNAVLETAAPISDTHTSMSHQKTSVPTVISKPHATKSLDTVLVKATGEASVTNSLAIDGDSVLTTSVSVPSAIPTTDSTSTSTKDTSSETSAGAKAGIVFGVLGGVLIIGLLVFLLFSRRRKQANGKRLESDNEKVHRAPGGGDTLPATPNHGDSRHPAPRLSLRPVTQFLPNLNINKRSSNGANMALAPSAATNRASPNNTWDRPSTSASNHPANPFGGHAERSLSPSYDHGPVESNAHLGRANPFADPLTANGPVVAQGPAGAAAAAAAAGGLSRKTSIRNNGAKDTDYIVRGNLGPIPPSPSGTEFSMSSLPPDGSQGPFDGAVGGPPATAVHRVQLDFRPTLDDEMGIKAGELVRLLHEYDDGWALCIRLDRSRQGVVPRTCLSTRPVKPRSPQGGPRSGPPVNPQGYPRGHPGPPMTQQGQRPMTPQGMGPKVGPMPGPGPRPASPAGHSMNPGHRPQSPGPRYQGPPNGRPQSPNGMQRQMSPPRPSPMNPGQSPMGPPTSAMGRKSVPGQAY